MPEDTIRWQRPHPQDRSAESATSGCAAGEVRELRLPPFDAEARALAIQGALPDSVLVVPARESVRWLVERHRTSLLASRRILMSSDEWALRVHGLPPNSPVVYLGPPPAPAAARELQAAARQRPVYAVVQAGHTWRQTATAAAGSQLPAAGPDAGFCVRAVRRCRELVRDACWQEMRICVADDAGAELIAELHHCAREQAVPLRTEELVGGGTSPVMHLLRLVVAGDLAADSLRLAGARVLHELGSDVSDDLADLASVLNATASTPQRAALLVSAGRSIHARCRGRELHPGLTARLLDRAERTAHAAVSLQEWLEDTLHPRWTATGHRDGVRVVRISRGAVHAVQTTIVPREVALANPVSAAAAYAVCAGAVVTIDAAAAAQPGR